MSVGFLCIAPLMQCTKNEGYTRKTENNNLYYQKEPFLAGNRSEVIVNDSELTVRTLTYLSLTEYELPQTILGIDHNNSNIIGAILAMLFFCFYRLRNHKTHYFKYVCI